MSDMIERATKALRELGYDSILPGEAAEALMAAFDTRDEALQRAIGEKVKLHYWNHHGARDPSPEFVDDLAGGVVLALHAACTATSTDNKEPT